MTWARRIVDEVEERLWAVDALRRTVYRGFAPVLAPYLAARGTRVAWLTAFVLASSLALAVVAPLPMLALGPLLLGVPHLVADWRYLVVRPRLHERPGAWAVGALLVVTALSRDLVPALLVAVPAAVMGRGPAWRRAAAAAFWLGAAGLAFVATRWTAFAVAQGHNFVAALIWTLLGGALHGPARARGWLVAAFVAAAAALALGAFDPVLAVTARWNLPGAAPLLEHAGAAAPFDDPLWRQRGVVTFAFAQSVHYGLWLRILPEEARPRPSTRSWRASFRALRAEVSDPLLAAALVATAAFFLWGTASWAGARHAYLAFAFFHGPLEFAVLTTWFVEGRVSARPPAEPG